MEKLLKGELRILDMVSAGRPIKDTMDAITLMIEELVPSSMCSILMLDQEGKRLFHGTAPSLPEDYVKEIDGLIIGPSSGVCGTAAFCGEIVVVDDVSTDPLTADYRHLFHKFGLRACWAVPFFDTSGKVLGTFALYNRQPHRPDEYEMQLVRTAAHLTGIAIERDRSEEAFRESEAKFRAITQMAADAIILISDKGKIVYWNKAAEHIFGYASEDAIGKDLHLLVIPSRYHSAYKEGLEKFLTGKVPAAATRFELDGLKNNGTEFPIEVSTSAIGIHGRPHALGIVRDITERKKAEEENIRLTAAIERASDNIIITDRNGTIRYANASFERLSGFSRKEIIGQKISILKSDLHDESFYKEMWKTVSSGNVWKGRINNRMKDGTSRESETTISSIRDNAGEIANFVSINRDVTHEAVLETRLIRAQKMEAIGTLAGGIAHDFNNILTAIIGYAELAISDTAEDSRLRRHLTAVLDAGLRARDLVSQILAFSRQTDTTRAPVSISSLVKEVLKLLRATLPSTIEIRQDIQCDEDTIYADPTQIHQVLMNLCTNAADAMIEKGGTLEVRLVEVEMEPDKAMHYLDLSQGPFVKLTVADTGQGIDRGIMERIFDPFFTTKGPGKGTGMGLAVVHGIVKSHGGAIAVYSEQGKGTTFDIFFPRIIGQIAQGAKAEEILPKGTERILLVDDEQGLVDLAMLMLKPLGYNVTPKTNSIDALETFRKNAYAFDLVITDQSMPGLNGKQLAKELMRIRSDIPIILCTGFSEVITRETAKEMGIREFVMKPFVIRKLAVTIRQVLDDKFRRKL